MRAILLVLGGVALATAACQQPIPPPRMSSSSSSNEGFATCPGGSSVVGGGYEIDPKLRATGRPPTVVSSRPTESGWKVECVDAEGKTVAGCRAFVLCASIL
jgi:hypothetical protein